MLLLILNHIRGKLLSIKEDECVPGCKAEKSFSPPWLEYPPETLDCGISDLCEVVKDQ
jgi:hypothetical protein